MPVSQPILDRVQPFIPANRAATVGDIRALYAADPDALFLLAIQGVGEGAPIAARNFEWLARTLSVLVRDSFTIATGAQQHYAAGNRGGFLALDGRQEDIRFVQGLYTGGPYASKGEPLTRSKACLDFFLEDHPWDDAVRGGRLLRIATDDAEAILGGLPRYQHESLLDCAREVVRSPAAVYAGLRHEGSLATGGFAFCGVPSRRRMNDGSFQPPPADFTFVVFADPEGYVFDWDWVPASKENPAIPRDVDDRFRGAALPATHGEFILGNVIQRGPAPFISRHPWLSLRGDCVFWYREEVESYAAREDEYLTVFYRLDGDTTKAVGLKLKVASRLVKTIRQWATRANEGILVDFSTDPVRVGLKFFMKAWAAQNLPRSEELFPGMRLMERLGGDLARELQTNSPTLAIPQSVAQPELQEA
jgi:hypothetical protein